MDKKARVLLGVAARVPVERSDVNDLLCAGTVAHFWQRRHFCAFVLRCVVSMLGEVRIKQQFC